MKPRCLYEAREAGTLTTPTWVSCWPRKQRAYCPTRTYRPAAGRQRRDFILEAIFHGDRPKWDLGASEGPPGGSIC